MPKVRLDLLLVERGLAESRAKAQALVMAGQVRVDGQVEFKASAQIAPEAHIDLEMGPRFVSRGGDKLEAALLAFPMDVSGRICVDVGASTGGFTDCLLQRGATEVVAVDVGRGQLAWTLREDPRVRVLERTNLRHLELAEIGEPAELATADLSFISLVLVAPALVRLTAATADLVVLVKPQFEVGRAQVGRGGIVRDPALHLQVLTEVAASAAGLGYAVKAVCPSPIRGTEGNREFFLHLQAEGAALAPEALEAAMVEVTRE